MQAGMYAAIVVSGLLVLLDKIYGCEGLTIYHDQKSEQFVHFLFGGPYAIFRH
jgi:hypothetical protein